MTSERERDASSTASAAGSNRTGVFVAATEPERNDAFAVRQSVFVDEQGVDEAVEYDAHDEQGTGTVHFVAYDDGVSIGAARLRPAAEPDGSVDDDATRTGKVERVAVVAERRGHGWGRRLMDAVEARARADGFERLALHAQTQVRGFYEALGYDAYGEVFEEAGIPHIAMDRRLDRDT
jgi:predicted GNAT family N-acyltransferase